MADTAHKRDSFQRERDLPRIAELYCKGKTQAEIAEALGLSRQQIGYDLRDIQNRWERIAAKELGRRKGRELARIDHLERVAWEAWARSCQDAKGTHVKTVRRGDGQDITTLEKTTKGQCGDPRFLERVAWCIAQRLEIMGAYAPKKVAPTTSEGNPFPVPDVRLNIDPAAAAAFLADVARLGNGVHPDRNGQSVHPS